MLARALLVGWAPAALLAPTSGVFVSLLIALLSGSVLLNVFEEKIPSSSRSHFGWFATGFAVYALLLARVTVVGERETAAEESGRSTAATATP